MVWTCRAQHRLDFRSTQAKCGNTEKIWQAKKSWDEVMKNDRKKLDMDSADPQNRSEWRGRLVKKPNPR